MIQVTVWAVLGTRAARVLLFPLAYMLFLVPFGEFLIAPLQEFTAEFVVRGVRLAGIPVFLDGLFIYIPAGTFVVAEICAGLRFLITTIALGFLVVRVFYRSAWRRVLFMSLAVVVPVIGNGIRAFAIVITAHLTDNAVAVSADHITFGLIVLGIITLCLLGIGMTFRERVPAPPPKVPVDEPARRGVAPAAQALAVTVAVALAAIAPAYGAYIHGDGALGPAPALASPTVSSPWTLAEAGGESWRPHFVGADSELVRTYLAGDRRVSIYIAYFIRQRRGAEVVGRVNNLAGPGDWERTGAGVRDLDVGLNNDLPGRVRSLELVSPASRRVVWHWYWVDGRATASPQLAKLLQARTTLLKGRPAAAAVAVSARYDERPGEAEAALEDFLAHVSGIEDLLRAAADGGERR